MDRIVRKAFIPRVPANRTRPERHGPRASAHDDVRTSNRAAWPLDPRSSNAPVHLACRDPHLACVRFGLGTA